MTTYFCQLTRKLTLEWIFHQKIESPTNVDVAAHWHEHSNKYLETDNENSIKDMAVCFFRLCQAARFGVLTLGRKGQPTRLEVDMEELSQFIAQEAFEDSTSINN